MTLPSRRALALVLLLAAICGVAFVLRTTNAVTVFVGDAVVFAENDPYYHMRRVFQILAAYPTVPAFDPWIDFPHGAPVVFAPLFDLGIATLAKLAGLGAADKLGVETLASFVPPLLGALTCLPLFWLARQTTSRAAALLAAALLALVPAHIWYSRLGFVDHHVAVTLVLVTMCALVLRALGVGRDPARTERWRRVVFAVLATLALAAGVLMWNGYLLLVALLDVFLVVLFVVSGAERRRAIGWLACGMHLGAALLVLPGALDVVRGTGATLSTVTLSLLHVAILVVTGAFAGVAAAVSARGWPLRRIALLAAALASLVVVALALERSAVEGVLRWLSASDPFMGAVQESVSILFESDGRLDLLGPQIWMTRFFFVVPVLLAILAYRVVRGGFADTGRVFVLVWTTLFFLLTLLQRRFAETAAPAMAILVADALVEAARGLQRSLIARGARPAAARGVAVGAAALVVVIAVWPYYRGFLATPDRLTALWRVPLWPGAAAAFSADDLAEQAGSSEVRLHRTLARFGALRRREAQALGARGAAPSGVMNPWPLGHTLLYVAGTPVTATPFGSYIGGSSFVDAVDFFLASDEQQALAILDRRGSHYVVVDNDLGTIGASIVGRGESPRDYYGRSETADGMVYTFRPPLLRSMYFRLTRLGGAQLELTAEDGTTEIVPALDHLRLVIDATSDDEIGFAKVYQVVRGATVVVHADPGAQVVARYAYTSDAGRQRVYEQTAVADAHGDARLVLPYSSERPDLGQAAAWSIESAGRRGELRPAERDVLDGRELRLSLD